MASSYKSVTVTALLAVYFSTAATMDAWLKRAPANASLKTAAAAPAAGQKAATSDGQQASNANDGTFPKIKVKSTAAPPGNAHQSLVSTFNTKLTTVFCRSGETAMGRKVQTEEH